MAVLDDLEKLAKLDGLIAKNRGAQGAVMLSLQEAQDVYGYVPREVQTRIADGLGVTLSEVYGVATFYSQFSLEPRGRFIVGVCMGTACYVRGAKDVLDKMCGELGIPVGKTTPDLRFTIRDTRCLGCCGLAPVIMINDDVYGQLTPDDIPDIVAKYKMM